MITKIANDFRHRETTECNYFRGQVHYFPGLYRLANRILPHQNPGCHACGFSLLEILICLAILSLLAALTAPSYITTLENRALIATAEAIAADLRWARSEALKRHSDVSVSFIPGDSWSYSIDANTTLKVVDNTGIPDFKQVSLTENFRKDSTTFSSLRGSSEGKNGTLELSHSNGNTILHVVLSNLGRVHICNAKGQAGDYKACT